MSPSLEKPFAITVLGTKMLICSTSASICGSVPPSLSPLTNTGTHVAISGHLVSLRSLLAPLLGRAPSSAAQLADGDLADPPACTAVDLLLGGALAAGRVRHGPQLHAAAVTAALGPLAKMGGRRADEGRDLCGESRAQWE